VKNNLVENLLEEVSCGKQNLVAEVKAEVSRRS
jgi:hypothetical protein